MNYIEISNKTKISIMVIDENTHFKIWPGDEEDLDLVITEEGIFYLGGRKLKDNEILIINESY